VAALTDVEVDSRDAPARGVNRAFLAVAIATALAAVAVSAYVAAHPVIPVDVEVEREVQLTDWGLLAYTFPFFTWIGDFKGVVLEFVIFFAVLILNRGGWVVAAGGAVSMAWYQLGIHLVPRPRPTTALVPHVYEHPGASSFPSGHAMIIVTVTIVLMLCFGHRFLSRWSLLLCWALVALVWIANGLSRVYGGARWPSDVLGGMLIAVAWMSVLLSIRWVSNSVLGRGA
jgi:membrane-associated phospholipid phosphatase